jgi:hypothetical protein
MTPWCRIACVAFVIAACDVATPSTSSLTQNGVVACESDAECDDGNPCTTDTCFTNYCRHTPNQNLCRSSTGSCDPAEYCQNGSCPSDQNSCVGGTSGSGSGGPVDTDPDDGYTDAPDTDLTQPPPPGHRLFDDLSDPVPFDHDPLQYLQGPVMDTAGKYVDVYLIFYGDFSPPAESLLIPYMKDLVSGLSNSAYYATLRSYHGRSGAHLGNVLYLSNNRVVAASSKYGGNSPSYTQLQQLVHDSAVGWGGPDGRGIYIVFAGFNQQPPSSDYCDTSSSGHTCGEHNHFVQSNHLVKWVYVPSSTTCLAVQGCTGKPNVERGQSPNGDVIDAAATAVVHEIAETMTDPDSGDLFAWIDDDGKEEADKCIHNFGHKVDAGGYWWNTNLGGHQWLLQDHWLVGSGKELCVHTPADGGGLPPGSAPIDATTEQPTGPMTCAGVATDTSSDPANCGDCGHACAGACTSGTCPLVPVVAAATGADAHALASGTKVYFSDNASSILWYDTASSAHGAYRSSENAPGWVTSAGGSGLKGEYFDAANLTSLKLTRTDPNVDFSWGAASPDPSIGADTFSVRWTGYVTPLYTETYRFYTTSDDGIRLWINGVEIINNWTNHGATENSGTIALVAGTRYSLKLEYYDNTGGATAMLSWSSPSQVKQIIPQSQLSWSDGLLWSMGASGTYHVRRPSGSTDIYSPAATSPFTGLAATSSFVYATYGDTLQILSPTLSLSTTIVADSPRGVVVSGSDVYWADSNAGAVFYRSLMGTICQVAGLQNFPGELAISGGHVYWTVTDGIARSPLATCTAPVEQVASGLSGARSPTSLAVDASESYVYWTDATRAYRATALAGSLPVRLTNDVTDLRATIAVVADQIALVTSTGLSLVQR